MDGSNRTKKTLSHRSPSAGRSNNKPLNKSGKKRAMPTVEDGNVKFTTMRQELLTKPS